MAWSGDISQMQLYDNPDVKFIVPAEGGMLWVDNMAIPAKAQHPTDAHVPDGLLVRPRRSQAHDRPSTSATSCPVPGAGDIIKEHATAAEASGDKQQRGLPARRRGFTARVPERGQLSKVYSYKMLTEPRRAVERSLPAGRDGWLTSGCSRRKPCGVPLGRSLPVPHSGRPLADPLLRRADARHGIGLPAGGIAGQGLRDDLELRDLPGSDSGSMGHAVHSLA